MGKIVYAHLEPGEDLYQALMEVVETEDIKTGLVMDITGGLTEVRLSMPTHGYLRHKHVPGVIEMDGLSEVSGHGIIGRGMADWSFPFGGIENVKDKPYLHVHLSVTAQGVSHTGHLIDGCRVMGNPDEAPSHFTVVLAEVDGVNLEFHATEKTERYRHGLAYHKLTAEN